MKMGSFEKRFVNAPRHSRHVARVAERRLRLVPLRPGQRCLDVGCGNGAACVRAAEVLGLDVTGVDVDPDQIELARRAVGDRPGVRFRVADATSLPFEDDAFDIVMTNKTTHHIEDWESAMAEMRRVLRPGGFLLYADLVLPRWLSALGRAVRLRSSGFPTSAGIDRFVRSTGLRVVRARRGPVSYDAVLQRPMMAGQEGAGPPGERS